MIGVLKSQFRKFLKSQGKEIVLIDDYEKSLQLVRYNWLKNMNIQTIIDVGASDGGYATKIRRIFPEAMIYSFEALEDSFEKLNKNHSSNSNFKSFHIALSNSKGEIDFYRTEGSTGASSILVMDELHKVSYPKTKNNRQIRVSCDRLDNILTSDMLKPNVLLKIDVQGAEKIVLEGAEAILKNVNLIYSEINFRELYKGAVLINDLMSFLKERGFRLLGIENVSQSLIDGGFLQGDAYFIRES